jgi:hypothetical protein
MERIVIENIESKNKKELLLTPCWIATPEVSVKVVLEHDECNLIATFDVTEKQLRRMSTHNNDEVYEDSCVEIFLKRDDEEFYRNFELSASTYMLVGKGSSRYDRIRYDVSRIEKIERSVQILENNNHRSHYIVKEYINLIEWNILKEGELIEDLKLFGNIYKCGPSFDGPHYLSYFKMKPNIEDFHKPECFGKIEFI